MTKPDFKSKSEAERRGRRAENLAALYLQLKGYKVLERRFKTKVGEIDLIAKRKKTIAMVEVKRRKTLADAQASLHPQALKRIERAAGQFLASRKNFRDCDVRFDAVFVLPGWRLKHLTDAWRRY